MERGDDPITLMEWNKWPHNRKVEVRGRCSHGREAREDRFQRTDGSSGVWSLTHHESNVGSLSLWEECNGTFTPNVPKVKDSPRAISTPVSGKPTRRKPQDVTDESASSSKTRPPTLATIATGPTAHSSVTESVSPAVAREAALIEAAVAHRDDRVQPVTDKRMLRAPAPTIPRQLSVTPIPCSECGRCSRPD
jgi:hypothetical protein